jgi:hypothetical protein
MIFLKNSFFIIIICKIILKQNVKLYKILNIFMSTDISKLMKKMILTGKSEEQILVTLNTYYSIILLAKNT